MLKFIHVSDLHFHRKPEHNLAIVGTLDYIREEYPHHYLIVTGDIVDDGHEAQYQQAQQALLPFRGRIFICPGNHDFGIRGNLYSADCAAGFDRWLAGPLDQGGTFAGENFPILHLLEDGGQRILLIALDTNLETSNPLSLACGQVGMTQLDALNTLLSDQALTGMIVMVFFHHHPFLHNDRFLKLLDARELMRILYGRVHVVLFGHRHVSKMWRNALGIPYILACDDTPGKAYAREITIVQQQIDINVITIEDPWDIVA
jgi:3',5'-cyclic AMP phosphodiesterase CpdA